MYDAIKSLNSKDIFITKADKGNCVIVIDKQDYDSGMQNLIDDGNYVVVKNPLNKMKTCVDNARKKYKELFGYSWNQKMLNSNAQVPCIYGLFKQHKPGNNYRPIVAGFDSPIAKLAAWLCDYFARLKSFDLFSVKNSFELAEKMKSLKLDSNHRLVSFDIKSYFSNVPRSGALEALREWLDKQNISPIIANALLDLTSVCIEQSYFQFRERFYKQVDGLAMGLSLSPFLCNLFMNSVEEKLRESLDFPIFYHRYVDDCIAIVDVDRIDPTLNLLNSICDEIQFTCECEENGALPFLDLLLIRNADGTIAFDIYRKSTSTDRYIPIESNHHISHRLAAFNSMCHRLVNIPLTPDRFNIERQKIIHIGETNGIGADVINQLIKKHNRKKFIMECTSLQIEKSEIQWCGFTYDAVSFERLQNVFKESNVRLAPKSNTKLKSLLNSTKDKRAELEKPGIYTATCAHSSCDAVYIGQTRRSVKKRANEHLVDIRNGVPKSGIAEHILENNNNTDKQNNHTLSITDFKLIEHEQYTNKLNILESMHIYLNREHNVNRDLGPHFSSLFSLLKL